MGFLSFLKKPIPGLNKKKKLGNVRGIPLSTFAPQNVIQVVKPKSTVVAAIKWANPFTVVFSMFGKKKAKGNGKWAYHNTSEIPTSEFTKLWNQMCSEYGCSGSQGLDGMSYNCDKFVPSLVGGPLPHPWSTTAGITPSYNPMAQQLRAEFERRYPGLEARYFMEKAVKRAAAMGKTSPITTAIVGANIPHAMHPQGHFGPKGPNFESGMKAPPIQPLQPIAPQPPGSPLLAFATLGLFVVLIGGIAVVSTYQTVNTPWQTHLVNRLLPAQTRRTKPLFRFS
jgi:hypothetical protein